MKPNPDVKAPEFDESKVPAAVKILHDAFAQNAATVVAAFPQHAPLAFLEPGSPVGYVIDMTFMFTDPAGKQRAINMVRQLVRSKGYEEVCFIGEASEIFTEEGETIPSSIQDAPDATDILAITIERPGALYCWNHPIAVADDGSRTMSAEYRYLRHTPGGMGQVSFLFLPENYERECQSYATNN